jgi:hypothetical protein
MLGHFKIRGPHPGREAGAGSQDLLITWDPYWMLVKQFPFDHPQFHPISIVVAVLPFPNGHVGRRRSWRSSSRCCPERPPQARRGAWDGDGGWRKHGELRSWAKGKIKESTRPGKQTKNYGKSPCY